MTNFVATYKKVGEPDKLEKARNWGIAIGLQQVDGLTPSKYLLETARENIDGKITIDEVENRIKKYYQTSDGKALGLGKEEADKVSARIQKLISDPSFSFVPTTPCAIHDKLFFDIYPDFAGKFRKVNITKSEDVLNGDTVRYGDANGIVAVLEYDFKEEKKVNYSRFGKQERIRHLADFISMIWQTHPFMEGNTRTTAVLAIKYMNALGFNTTNELFEKYSAYFRNALVRANYQNLDQNIPYTKNHLYNFFDNLLLGGRNALDNNKLRIVAGGIKTTKETTGKTTDKIIAAIRKNPNITMAALADITGITADGVKWQLHKLKKQGRVRRVGARKLGHWEIIEKKDV